MDYAEHGFVRVAAMAPPIDIGNPDANAASIAAGYEAQAAAGATLVVTPELALTGYTCEDLFTTAALIDGARGALLALARQTGEAVLVVGAPWRLADGRLVNAAFVCRGGRILGAVPKSANPNHEEFYERRWFVSGSDVATAEQTALGGFEVRTDQLFDLGRARVGIELCEDLWAPAPPSISHALAGAELIVNLSASNELVAKADYRRDLVRLQSARLICGYLYSAAGVTESTKDLVFGGHLIAAENGQVLAEAERFRLEGTQLAVDFDCAKLRHHRARNATFAHSRRLGAYARVDAAPAPQPLCDTGRSYARQPFVPEDEGERDARAREILAIQATGLARRMQSPHAGIETLVIGISGGLDSTLALLVCLDALAVKGLPLTALRAITMPGPGTTAHTLATAKQLAGAAGATLAEIPISDAVARHLQDIGHDGVHDVTFENAQARERTQVLFDIANRERGIVLGTGDLSELALGWCTYNADHMAHYNVNCGVPKTLVAYLVRWYARHRADAVLAAALQRVLDTPITPELLPSGDGNFAQRTEAIVGPYELHDFFLYHLLRTGAGPAKGLALARLAFGEDYPMRELKRWLRVFLERFYASQFKRSTLPPGPKVGTVSLSPRGDWRMPDEASATAALAALDAVGDECDAAAGRTLGRVALGGGASPAQRTAKPDTAETT